MSVIYEKTQAQEFFGQGKLLTSRPEGMLFSNYRELLKLQNQIIKKLFRHKPSRRVASLMPVRPFYNQH